MTLYYTMTIKNTEKVHCCVTCVHLHSSYDKQLPSHSEEIIHLLYSCTAL